MTQPSDALQVSFDHRSERAVVLVARGELDLTTAGMLREVLNSREAQAPVKVLDLRSVGFIDSSGLSVLVEHHQQALSSGGSFAVAVGNDTRTRRLMGLSGLAETLKLVDEPEAVLGHGA